MLKNPLLQLTCRKASTLSEVLPPAVRSSSCCLAASFLRATPTSGLASESGHSDWWMYSRSNVGEIKRCLEEK